MRFKREIEPQNAAQLQKKKRGKPQQAIQKTNGPWIRRRSSESSLEFRMLPAYPGFHDLLELARLRKVRSRVTSPRRLPISWRVV
jgi:hypothetical protein